MQRFDLEHRVEHVAVQRPVEAVNHERIRCRALRQPVAGSGAVVVGVRRAQRGHLFRQLRALGERTEVEAATRGLVADLLIWTDEAALVQPGDAHAALALRGGGADAVPADRLRLAIEVHAERAVYAWGYGK